MDSVDHKETYIDKVLCTAGHGDYYEWQVCASDDGTVLATTCIEHLAEIIKKAIDDDIAANEANAWE